MKSLIVIYVPVKLGATKTEKDVREEIIKGFKASLSTEMQNTYDFLYMEDPSRDKVEVEVFFNPF